MIPISIVEYSSIIHHYYYLGLSSPFSSRCKIDTTIQKKRSDNPCVDEYLAWPCLGPQDTRALPTKCRCNAAGNVATTLWLCPTDVKTTALFRLLLVVGADDS